MMTLQSRSNEGVALKKPIFLSLHVTKYKHFFKLRTFASIAIAHRYYARKFTRHVMHRARALSNKVPCGTARLAVLSSRAEPNSAVPLLMVSNGVLLPCGTARLAVLSSRAEPNSAVPRLMVSNGVLLPCINRNDNLIGVRHGSSTTFGTGLRVFFEACTLQNEVGDPPFFLPFWQT